MGSRIPEEGPTGLRRGLALFGRGLWPAVAVLVLMSLVAAAITAAAVLALSELAWAQRSAVFAGGELTGGGVLRLLLQVGLPAALALAFAAAAGFAALAAVFGDRWGGSARAGIASALWRGARRALPFAGAFLLAALEVLAALVLAPIVSLVGLVLLAVFGVRRLFGRPVPGGWFSWPMLVASAIPFGLAAVILVHSLLVLPVAAMEHRGVAGILRRSSGLVRGHRLRTVLYALVGFAVYAAALGGIAALGLAGLPPAAGTALTLLAQVTVVAVPVALLVAAYFEAVGGRVPPEHAVPRPSFARGPLRAAVATGVAAALVIGLAVVVPAQPAWAEEGGDPGAGLVDETPGGSEGEGESGEGAGAPMPDAGAFGESAEGGEGSGEGGGPGGSEGEPPSSPDWWYPGLRVGSPACFDEFDEQPFNKPTLGMCLDSLGDQGDANPGDGWCETSLGSCTLRAALEELSAWRAGHAGIFPANEEIASGTILLTAPLVATTRFGLHGDLGADWSEFGSGLTIDGQYQQQLFRISTGSGGGAELSGVTLRNGLAPSGARGGAVQVLAGGASLSDVTLDMNDAVDPGAASALAAENGALLGLGRGVLVNNAVPACHAVDIQTWLGPTTIDAEDDSCAGASYDGETVSTAVSVTATPAAPARGGPVEYRVQVTRALAHPEPLVGTVTLYVDGREPITEPVPGDGLVAIPSTAAGIASYTVRVVYSGSPGHRASQAETIVTTQGATSALALEMASDTESGWYRGHPLTLTATATSGALGAVPTGEVVFSGGGEELGRAQIGPDGRAVLETTITSADGESFSGNGFRWAVGAAYAGDADHGASEQHEYLFLAADATSTTITPSAANAAPGDSVTFTARVVSQAPGGGPVTSGTVRFVSNGIQHDVPIGAQGEAALALDNLGYGTRTVSASYLGSPNRLLASSANIDYSVTGSIGSSLDIDTGGVQTYAGDDKTYYVYVRPASGVPTDGLPDPTGVRRIVDLDSGLVLAQGTGAELVVTGLAAGTYRLRVEFLGDSVYRAASLDRSLTVITRPTVTYLSRSPHASVVGQPIEFGVTVQTSVVGELSQPVTSGEVSILSGGALVGTIDLAQGATLTAPLPFALGSAELRAVYQGDDYRAASQSTASSHTQSRATAAVSLDLAQSTVPYAGTVEATVRVTGVAPSAGVPLGGGVQLLDGGAAVAEIPAKTLAGDGTATFSFAAASLGPGIHHLEARFTGSPWFDDRSSATAPLTVPKHTPVFELSASGGGASVWGGQVTLDADVHIPWIPNLVGTSPLGVVDFALLSGGIETPLGSVAVTEQYRRATLAVPRDELPVGEHEFIARFTPSVSTMDRLTVAVADTVPHAVAAVPVEIDVLGLEGILPGEAFVRSIMVREHPDFAAHEQPEGAVRVTLDGAVLGDYPLATLELSGAPLDIGYANVDFPALAAGPHTLSVQYLPAAGGHHASRSTEFDFTAGRVGPAITLEADTRSVDFDSPLAVRASAAAPFPWYPEPRGTLVVSDGAAGGSSCEIAVMPGAPAPQTECTIIWETAGERTLRAVFVPDASEQTYEETTSTGSLPISVRQATPGLSVFAAATNGAGQRPTAGDTVRVSWSLSGTYLRTPAGGVTLTQSPAGAFEAGAFEHCDTSRPSGSCEARLTVAGAAAVQPGATVSYAGDERFAPRAAVAALTPRACVPLDLRIEPAGAGTLVPQQAANCGEPGQAKTGYAENTVVTFDARPSPSNDPSFDWQLSDPAVAVTTAAGPGNGLIVTAQHDWARADFVKSYQCVLVSIDFSTVAGTLGEMRLPGQPGSAGPAPNCLFDGMQRLEQRYQPGAGSWSTSSVPGSSSRYSQAWYLRGTELSGLELLPGRPDTKVYRFESSRLQREGDWGVAAITLTQSVGLKVSLGPTCYAASTQATGPGTVAILNAPNCAEPDTATGPGTRGWFAGTALDVYARPGAEPQGSLAFVKAWGGTDRFPGGAGSGDAGPGAATALAPPGGTDSTAIHNALVRNGRFTELNPGRGGLDQLETVRVIANAPPPRVVVDFGVCHAVTIRHGLASDGSAVADAGGFVGDPDCPLSGAAVQTRPLIGAAARFSVYAAMPDAAIAYFEEGSEVTVEAPAYRELKDRRRAAKETYYFGEQAAFGGWLLNGGSGRYLATREPTLLTQARQSLVVTRPTVLQPQYAFRSDCMVDVSVWARDGSRVQVSTRIDESPPTCNTGSLEGGPGTSLYGTLPGRAERPTAGETAPDPGRITLTAHAAEGLDPLLGWEIRGRMWNPDTEPKYYSNGSLMPTQSSLEVTQSIPAAQVQIPYGFLSLSAKAVACQQLDFSVNVRDESGRTIRDYTAGGDELLMVSPAPNCPFAPNAWIAGTEVELWAFGNPLGYEFTGWEGDVAPNTEAFDDELPAEAMGTITMDGRSPTAKVAANYDLHCFDVTLRGYAGEISMYPEPNCPGFEGRVRTAEYSNDWLMDRYGGTQQGQARDYTALRKMAGPYSKTGRYIGGTEVYIRTGGVSDRVWTGWKGDVAQEGRINPNTVHVGGDSIVDNTFRGKTTGEKFEDFGNDMAVLGKKIVGFTAAAVTEYVKYLPPIGVVTTVADLMSLAGTILEAAGVSKGDVAWLHYAKQMVDLPFSVLGCVGTWGMGSSTGATLAGAGLAAEAARQKTYRITNITDQVTNIAETRAAMSAGETGLAMSAKLKFYQARLGLAQISKVTGPVVSTGMVVYSAFSSGSVAWDRDASSAWGDWSGYTSCLKQAVPGFVLDAIGGTEQALRELAGSVSARYDPEQAQQAYLDAYTARLGATATSQPRRPRRGAPRTPQGLSRGRRRAAPPRRRAQSPDGAVAGAAARARGPAGGALALALLAALALTGCAADWGGERRLASEECSVAAQLFAASPNPEPVEGVAPGSAGPAEPTTEGPAPLDREALAGALRPYVLDELQPVLDDYAAGPGPDAGAAAAGSGSASGAAPASAAEQQRIAEQTERFLWAQDALRQWAVLVCGEGVSPAAAAADVAPEALPSLGEVQVTRATVDGAPFVGVAGALEPDHAVALCEEARAGDPGARVEVTDVDGFPLALAEPGGECGYDPILLTGLDEEAIGQ